MNVNSGKAAAPATSGAQRRDNPLLRNRRRAIVVRLGFLGLAVAIAVWGIAHNPSLRNRRLAGTSLADLQRMAKAQPNDPDVLYYTGLRLDERGRFAEAAPLLKEAAVAAPDQVRIREEWMRALLGIGRTADAYAELKQFVDAFPRLGAAHRLLGQFYTAQHSMIKANQELSQAVQIDPNDRAAWVFLAMARDNTADPQGAISAEERAIAMQPNYAGDHLYLGTLYTRSNRPQDALKEFLEAIRLDPHFAAAHREYARWLLTYSTQPADRDRAQAEARQSVALDSQDAQAQQTLGEALVRQGKSQEALAPLTAAARLAPDDPAPARRLWELQRALGRQVDAGRWQREYLARQSYTNRVRSLVETIEMHPDNTQPHAQLADLLARHGDAEGCLRQYAAAMRASVEAPQVLTAAVRGLLAGGHGEAAVTLAQRVVQTGPGDLAAREMLGDALLAAGQPRAAMAEYQVVANTEPDRAGTLRLRLAGYLAHHPVELSPAEKAYREARRIEATSIGPKHITPQVEQLAQQAVTLEPTNATYLSYLLHLQVARRYNDRAMETARRLIALSPSDANAHVLLGILMLDRAASKEALDAAEAQLRTVPPPTPAIAAEQHFGLGLLALQRRQAQTAVEELKAAQRLDPTADVTYYKLALAENMLGDTRAGAVYMAQYQSRQTFERKEADLLGDIAQHPEQASAYERAIAFLKQHGLGPQAEAVRAAERQRLGARPTGAGHA
ncbi:MAG TPA: tetratricopeptide repeat protein [Chthonomonadaceae bacterium]|nr:tetratricopeptide repeat protein [Chthonomonadaceae bacterium]